VGNAAVAQDQTAIRSTKSSSPAAGRSPNPKPPRFQVQRNSDSLVSVVAADTVGAPAGPEHRQAVARVPGAAVEGDQGQARYVSLRGAPNYWTTLSINGIGIVSPEAATPATTACPRPSPRRSSSNKAVTPDLTGETISGNINIITRSAFDYPGLSIAGKLGAAAELGGPRTCTKASW